MLPEETEDIGKLLMQGSLSPEKVAKSVIRGLEKEECLIHPHPEVADYFKAKANDYERWLRQMHRVQEKYV